MIDGAALPALPGALKAAAAGVRTGGDPRNRDFVCDRVDLDGLPSEIDVLGHDPQTAGGLLVSIPPARGRVLEAEFAQHDLLLVRIGQVEGGSGVVVH
jgi:selenide,water dikinase